MTSPCSLEESVTIGKGHVCNDVILEYEGEAKCITCTFCFSVGYYIEPTIVEVKNPHDKLMEEVKNEIKMKLILQ